MIEINNLTSIAADKEVLKKIAGSVLKGEKKQKFGLSIALVGRAEIRKLNKQYLKKEKATDVLAFPKISSFAEISRSEKIENLGEIIICPQEVRKNAKDLNSTFNKELYATLIHGILHLLGYTHGVSAKEKKRMQKKEDYYLQNIT